MKKSNSSRLICRYFCVSARFKKNTFLKQENCDGKIQVILPTLVMVEELIKNCKHSELKPTIKINLNDII